MLESRLEIELESADLECVGMERMYDRPSSDAEFDARSMGYGGNWVVWCTRAIQAKKNETPSKVQKAAMGGQEKLLESELTDCSREERSGRQLHTTLDRGTWNGVAASGGEWLRWLRWLRWLLWCQWFR